LAQSPGEEIYSAESDHSQELQQIDARIERLVSAIAESSEVTVSYISAQIDKLHQQRDHLLQEMQAGRHKGAQRLCIDFDQASFDEKKIIAREFIEKILLHDDTADVIWKV
jgi:predicted transcriptional regulator